jgi:hypothetical protein
MFEDDGDSDPIPKGAAVPSEKSVHDLIAACAAEAKRQAAAMQDLDGFVGDVLMRGTAAVDPRALQRLDLLRQEADGLARVLQLVASQAQLGIMVDGTAVTACLPLAAQRARISEPGNTQ